MDVTYAFKSGSDEDFDMSITTRHLSGVEESGSIGNPLNILSPAKAVLDGYIDIAVKRTATTDDEKITSKPIDFKVGTHPVTIEISGTGAASARVKAGKSKDSIKACSDCIARGYLEVPTPGPYRFYKALEDTEDKPVVTLHFAHLATPTIEGENNGYVELKPGILYPFTLSVTNLQGGKVRILVQGETLSKGDLFRLPIYPFTTITQAEKALLLLQKSLQMIQGFGLSEREILYLLRHGDDFDGLNFSRLPVDAVGETPDEKEAVNALFTQFLHLAGYARLKQELAPGSDDLIEIFEACSASTKDQLYTLIAKLTRRDQTTVRDVAEGLSATTPTFKTEKSLERLWTALKIVERLGVHPASLCKWIGIDISATSDEKGAGRGIIGENTLPEDRYQIARDLKQSVKSRFEEDAWQRVAQPIFDRLRQFQRDALVSYVMHLRGFGQLEELYGEFLMDPGMEPVVQTSRIRLAIASVQLFIQRCLLNLETEVHPSTINSKHWEWMRTVPGLGGQP